MALWAFLPRHPQNAEALNPKKPTASSVSLEGSNTESCLIGRPMSEYIPE